MSDDRYVHGCIVVPRLDKQNQRIVVAGVDLTELASTGFLVADGDFKTPMGVITAVMATPDFVAVEAQLLSTVPDLLGLGREVYLAAGGVVLEMSVQEDGVEDVLRCRLWQVCLTLGGVRPEYLAHAGRLPLGFAP